MKLCWISTPTRDGKVHARMMNQVNMLQVMAARGESRGWAFGYDATQGSPNVPRQRNWAIAKAKAHDADAVLFVDSDIEFNPDHVIDLLERDEAVIGISHQTRARRWTDPPNMSGRFYGPDPKKPRFDPNSDLLRAQKLTTGLLLCRMSAFDRIREAGLVRQFVASAIPSACWPHLHDYFLDEDEDFTRTLEQLGTWMAHHVNDAIPPETMKQQLRDVGLADDMVRAMDGEDWDFNVRCEKAGVEMFIEPLGSLNHYEGSTAFNLDLHLYWTLYHTAFRDEYLAWLAKRAERCERAAKRLREVGKYALAA